MFLPEARRLQVFAHLAPVDMRKQRYGLAALEIKQPARSHQRVDPGGTVIETFRSETEPFAIPATGTHAAPPWARASANANAVSDQPP